MKADEKKAWIAFMVAAMGRTNFTTVAAARADRALEEYRKRFPAIPSNWQQDQP